MLGREALNPGEGLCHQVRGGKFELKAATTSADEHGRPLRSALVDHERKATLLAERAYPPDHVAGRSLCLRRVGHRRLLRSEGDGQGLQVKLAGNRYHRDDQAGGGCSDKGFQDSRWLCPDRLRCLPAVGAAGSWVYSCSR